MNRIITTNKNLMELNTHGTFGFPLNLLYVTLSAYPFGRFDYHWHSEIELCCILKGEMIYQINQDAYHLKKGDCLFVNANVLHSGYIYQENDCQYIALTFSPVLISGYENSSIEKENILPILSADTFSALLFRSKGQVASSCFTRLNTIGYLYKKKDLCYKLHIKALLCEIWCDIYSEFNTLCPIASDITQQKQISRLKNALNFIHTNYANAITLDEMAAACHISKSEFCRIFKKTLHQSPFEYLLRYRIQKSLPGLASDALNITEVANQVGFSGSSYYSEVFRKYMNCSPREYKKTLIK